MIEIAQYEQQMNSEEKAYINEIQKFLPNPLQANHIWKLIDKVWYDLECDKFLDNGRLSDFYKHPVWLLNGIFIEGDRESLGNRRIFTSYIEAEGPKRVADVGGGMGTLARMIGDALPNTFVEIVEPHPNNVATELVAKSRNVAFVKELSGEYDLLISTDVFEHLLDPLKVVHDTSKHISVGGKYLIANCFAPVMKCHLPNLFHFNTSWDTAMQAMGLIPGLRVAYGREYIRSSHLSLSKARKVEELSNRLWPILEWLPRGRSRVGGAIIKLLYVKYLFERKKAPEKGSKWR